MYPFTFSKVRWLYRIRDLVHQKSRIERYTTEPRNLTIVKHLVISRVASSYVTLTSAVGDATSAVQLFPEASIQARILHHFDIPLPMWSFLL